MKHSIEVVLVHGGWADASSWLQVIIGVTTPNVKNRTFRTVAKTCRHPQASAIHFCNPKYRLFQQRAAHCVNVRLRNASKSGLPAPPLRPDISEKRHIYISISTQKRGAENQGALGNSTISFSRGISPLCSTGCGKGNGFKSSWTMRAPNRTLKVLKA
jgi:hypothetical protein